MWEAVGAVAGIVGLGIGYLAVRFKRSAAIQVDVAFVDSVVRQCHVCEQGISGSITAARAATAQHPSDPATAEDLYRHAIVTGAEAMHPLGDLTAKMKGDYGETGEEMMVAVLMLPTAWLHALVRNMHETGIMEDTENARAIFSAFIAADPDAKARLDAVSYNWTAMLKGDETEVARFKQGMRATVRVIELWADKVTGRKRARS